MIRPRVAREFARAARIRSAEPLDRLLDVDGYTRAGNLRALEGIGELPFELNDDERDALLEEIERICTA